ncbi:excinuclease ABC subunit UvrC [Methylacidimicrobium tartarophylax]|uniref:UvrABC system protein C n=1 Tax=Methylacidimicrobium tartarophylax TaxID=1041768 RepID=A0A5E6M877_9BACT|nr:excinuclease ABC subunit UvrC [Methylacidimicrobium tartarophylax]VVM05761.1 UvrABC system protein C [Methylacidimicrobium tartarophylax]
MSVARPELEKAVRDFPQTPGVYLFRDRLDRVIYVGKARNLHKRVAQYFHPSRGTAANRKIRAMVEVARRIEYHTVRSEAEAILLEGKLIKEYRPRYNVSFRDDKRFLLVKTNLREPFPRFQITRLRKDDGCRYFGPFASSGALRTTINWMKKIFGLRSCAPLVPGEKDYKHCLDRIIKNCSAPCLGTTIREEYRVRVESACSFLEGKSREMAEEIRKKMEEAAARWEFERAAELRNLWEDLRQTTRPVKRFLRSYESAISPAEDLRELAAALGLSGPPQIMECFDISNISTLHKVASMVVFEQGRPARGSYRRYRIRTVPGQDDFASIAEAVQRRYRRVLDEGTRRPDLIVIDGGAGQLSAARRELLALGLTTIPVIGLAKENEEIYRPHHSLPLQLPRDSGAIRLLQRLRDEAHRFANAYHQLLLRQRVRESLLDDCPGISRNRKRLLLQTFGSVDRLRKASVEEIAEVQGIGRKLAESVFDYLAEDRRSG